MLKFLFSYIKDLFIIVVSCCRYAVSGKSENDGTELNNFLIIPSATWWWFSVRLSSPFL